MNAIEKLHQAEAATAMPLEAALAAARAACDSYFSGKGQSAHDCACELLALLEAIDAPTANKENNNERP